MRPACHQNDRLRHLIRQLQRLRFGRRSEKLDPDQLNLALEDVEQAIAETEAQQEKADPAFKRARAETRRAGRGSLPEHLPRVEIVIEPETTACRCCGGAMQVIGEDRSSRLDVIPAQYRVLITRRPKYACRNCQEGVVQAAAPARLIAGGLPTERLVAQVLVAKYADHCPLYRQSQILARQGIVIDRSTLAFWVGYTAAEIKPLWRLMREDLLRSTKLFVDDTPVPVLEPGLGRTRTGDYGSCPRRPAVVRPRAAGGGLLLRPDRGGEHRGALARGLLPAFSRPTPMPGSKRRSMTSGRAGKGTDHRSSVLGASMDRPWSARQKYGVFGRLRSCAAIHSAWCRGALAAGPDDIRSSVPYHWCGLRVRCAQRVRRNSVRPDLPSMPVLPSHSPRDGSAYAASALLVGWN